MTINVPLFYWIMKMILGGEMITITTEDFLQNPSHYLTLAEKESVAIKSDKKRYWITPEPEGFENPSPSGDPYWDDPRKVEELRQIIKLRDEGKLNLTPLTREERKELLGL